MTPRFLQSGDTIGIVATARWVSIEQLQPAITLFSQWGYRIKIGKYTSLQRYQLAGSDAQRAEDLQTMLDDPSISAIIIARGGYGTVRIIDQINWDKFDMHPKWICGYSDASVLLNVLTNKNTASIHSVMPISFPDATPEALQRLRAALSGQLREIKWISKNTIQGTARGRIVGGNLSVIFSQLGSSSQLQTQDVILFLEDVDEMVYHIDRMMMGLKRAGMFDSIRGVIIGGLTQMKDNTQAFGFPTDNPWGMDAEEILLSFFSPLHIPVATGFSAGHIADNGAFYMGVNAELQVHHNGIFLKYTDI